MMFWNWYIYIPSCTLACFTIGASHWVATPKNLLFWRIYFRTASEFFLHMEFNCLWLGPQIWTILSHTQLERQISKFWVIHHFHQLFELISTMCWNDSKAENGGQLVLGHCETSLTACFGSNKGFELSGINGKNL